MSCSCIRTAKSFFVFFVAVLLVLSATINISAQDTSSLNAYALEGYDIGDVNGDGKLNTDDAIYLLRHTLLPSSYPVNQLCDFNGDGKVNTDDAIYLLRHTLLPSQYPLIVETVVTKYLDKNMAEVAQDDDSVVYCEKEFYKGGKITKTERYTYPENLLCAISEYDENGNITKHTGYNSDGSYFVTTYDENGNKIKTENYDKNGNLIVPVVTTTTAKPVTTTVPTPVTTPIPSTDEPMPYEKLYVGYNKGSFENASLILEFHTATAADDVLSGDKYLDENEYAESRFSTLSSTYDKFIAYKASKGVVVSGGTAPVKSPWKFKNYYLDGYWCFEGGYALFGDGGASYTDTYRDTLVSSVKSYYITNGKWAKVMGASNFGKGYFHMGLNSALDFSSAVSAAKVSGDGSYTVQIVAQRFGGGALSASLGQSYEISEQQNGAIRIEQSSADNYSSFGAVTTNRALKLDIDNVNTYTFSFDRSRLSLDNSATLGININTHELASNNVTELSCGNEIKVFEGADANIYAVRVYDYVLTEDEILQNHFADMAAYFHLDITEFLQAKANKKTEVYKAFGKYSFDTIITYDAQELLDEILGVYTPPIK